MTEAKRYAPVGRCIYCGATPGLDKLGDEHIIPFALNGKLILPKASCHDCGAITGATVEQEVLRKMLIDVRIHQKMRTRNKKGRPNKLKVARFNPDMTFAEWEYLPVDEHPYATVLPNFGLPTDLFGGPHTDQFFMNGVSLLAPLKFVDQINKLGNGKGYVQTFHPEMFTRMLAKIAHSYAVAELGWGAFECFLPDVILGRSASISRYVGSAAVPDGPTDELHTVRLSRARGYIDVYIRLFANYGGRGACPTYLVVTGR